MPSNVKIEAVPPADEPVNEAYRVRTIVDVANQMLDTVVDRGAIPLYRRLTNDADVESVPPTKEEHTRMRLAVIALGVGWLAGRVLAPRRVKTVTVERPAPPAPSRAEEPRESSSNGALNVLMPLVMTVLKALLDRRTPAEEPPQRKK